MALAVAPQSNPDHTTWRGILLPSGEDSTVKQAVEDTDVSAFHSQIAGVVSQKDMLSEDNFPDASWHEDEDAAGETTDKTKKHLGADFVRLGSESITRRSLLILQQWEGIIDVVDRNSVFVHFYDIQGPTHCEHYAELDADEFDASDATLLSPGETVYWTIGYKSHRDGAKERFSQIRLKRTPRISKSLLRRASYDSSDIDRLLGRHNAGQPTCQ